MSVATFPCTSCGAELEFKPGTRLLTCPYCRKENEIPQLAEEVQEQDFESVLGELGDKQEGHEVITVRCDSCRAEVPMAPNVTSQSCPFCGSNIVATGTSQKHIKPRSLLPFAVDRNKALKQQNDSLAITTRARKARIDRMVFLLDSTKKELDTALAHIPPSETLYIGHRAQAASLSYRRKWHDMGVLPRDTTAH